jgi:predicted Fe-Mo cluster-binding NifX family protein
MNVVITCRGETLEDQREHRFGCCRTSLVVDIETLDVETIQNHESYKIVGPSIGIAKQLTHHDGVEAVITGRIGPNTAQILETAGISVYVGAKGTVRQALKFYRAKRFSGAPPRPKRLAGKMGLRDGGISRKATDPPRPGAIGKVRGKGWKHGAKPSRFRPKRSSVHLTLSRRGRASSLGPRRAEPRAE